MTEEWSPGTLREMHDRELAAQKELLSAEIKRLDEESETQVARAQEAMKSLQEAMSVSDQALKNHIEAQYQTLEAALAAQQREQDKFVENVKARFEQVNEFRAALGDLGKEMATRRELEAAIKSLRDERETLFSSVTKAIEGHADGLADLRSRVDVGPQDLRALKDRSERFEGAQQRSQQISGSVVAWVAIGVGVFAALIGYVAAHV